MMSIETIRHLSRKVAVLAAMEGIEPYVPANAQECLKWRRIPIPNLGDYRPEGWRLIDAAFVDKTGFGRIDEPAMTIDAFKRWCADVVSADPYAGFGIIEEGQFQLWVGYFTSDPDVPSMVEDTGDTVNPDDWGFCPRCDGLYEYADGYCYECGWSEEDNDYDEES